jgi:hypothetical protein
MAILDKSFGVSSGPSNMPDKVNIHNQSQKTPAKPKHTFPFKSSFSQIGTHHEWFKKAGVEQQDSNRRADIKKNRPRNFFKKPNG